MLKLLFCQMNTAVLCQLNALWGLGERRGEQTEREVAHISPSTPLGRERGPQQIAGRTQSCRQVPVNNVIRREIARTSRLWNNERSNQLLRFLLLFSAPCVKWPGYIYNVVRFKLTAKCDFVLSKRKSPLNFV